VVPAPAIPAGGSGPFEEGGSSGGGSGGDAAVCPLPALASAGEGGGGRRHLSQQYTDGSLEKDLPIQELSEQFNVNVSSINYIAVLIV